MAEFSGRRRAPVWLCVVGAGVAGLLLPGASAVAEPAGAEPSRARLAQAYPPYYPPYYRLAQSRRKKTRRKRRSRVRGCRPPWSYSRGLRRCVCARAGYGLSRGRCVKLARVCPTNAAWSEQARRCVCNNGFIEKNRKCIDPALAVAAVGSGGAGRCMWPRAAASDGAGCVCAAGFQEREGRCVRDASLAPAAATAPTLPDPRLPLAARVQTCLKRLGFQKSKVRNRMTPPAWTAFWRFKRRHRVGSTPRGIYDKKLQKKLFALCAPATSKVAALTAQQAVAADALTVQSVKRVYARPEAGCLPKELYDLVTRTYGRRATLKRCRQTCIAIPRILSERVLAEYESKRGIVWCRSCIELSSSLPLDDILRIERGANVQICTRPPSQLPRWVHPARLSRQAYTKVREIYRALPSSGERNDDIAVIIGNRRYHGDLPANETAHNNAGAIYALLTEHLGYRFDNIVDLRDATLKDLNALFGSADSHQGDLWRRTRKRKDARILIYYAGHGRASADQSNSYLLPVDAVKHREERTAYPISRLYANLRKLGAKSVLVLLEAGFGRDLGDFVFPPNVPEMWVRSLPLEPIRGLTVMTAADRDQKTLDDPRYGIGLFTRYLLEGLAGRADLAPIGNGDGRIEAVELYAYTAHMVGLAARKSFGLLQRPLLSNRRNVVVSRVEAQSR